MRRVRGFTIVELLITMVVIAILAAIAFPSYQSHTRKAARAATQAAMMQIADRQAQYLLDARNYAVSATALSDLSFTVPPDVSGKYTITVTNSSGTNTPETPPSYTIKATPIGSQAQDGILTLTHTGVKTRAGNTGW